MRSLCAHDPREVDGCLSVVKAWSGGAYDDVHRRMVVWGGGHEDDWGNELYAFDLRTGTWSRLTDPSVAPAGTDPADLFSRDQLPDGIGTYGRWRRVARDSVFILVNSVDENVYFYKNPAGCGPP